MIYRAYHAGPASALHIPIHGGIGIYNRTVSVVNPATGARTIDYGTLGCIVTHKTTNKPYILSNQHVLYPSGKKYGIGDLIYEQGTDKQAIGRTSQFGHQLFFAAGEPYIDAALAEPLAPVSYEIPGIGYIRGMTEPVTGMKIKLLGARSGFLTGQITNANPVVAGKQGLFFHNAPSIGGDSGSAIVSDPDNLMVGLNMQTSMVGGVPTGIGCRASAIAAKFNIDYTAAIPVTPAPSLIPVTPTPLQPSQLGTFLSTPQGQQIGMIVIAGLIVLALVK